MKHSWPSWVMALALCAVMFWFNAGERAFWGRHGEARRAEVSREMAASGEWVVPHLNGEPFVTKPPLYYWAAAAAFAITGDISEFNARLPSLLSATLGVLLVMLWGRVLFSARVGLLAGIVLATNFLYVGMARMAEIDMLLTLFTTAALASFSMGLARREHAAAAQMPRVSATTLFLGTAVWMGLGNLTKNPIGLAVPLVAIVGYILLSRDFKVIPAMKPWWGALMIAAMTLPWFALVYRRVPNFFEVLEQETIGRYLDPDGTPHLQPFYYYIPSLAAFAPWVLFLPAVIIQTVATGWRNLSRSRQFLLMAAAAIFLLFSSVGSKREYYLLPLYPVLALLVALAWDDYITLKQPCARRWTWRAMDIPILAFAGLLGILGVALPIAAAMYLPHYLGQSLGFGLSCAGGGVVLGVLFVRKRPRAMFWTISAAAVGLYLFALLTIIPEMDLYRSRRGFFHDVRALVGEAAFVDFDYLGLDAQFYMQRLVDYRYVSETLSAYLTEHPDAFVMMTDKGYQRLQHERPDLAVMLTTRLDRSWASAVEPGRTKRLFVLQPRQAAEPPASR
jgi:4-amino-4-deoxy-L-arabinose transferase-like glycosyltransferase